jgi:CheY-like chemotaxis protein
VFLVPSVLLVSPKPFDVADFQRTVLGRQGVEHYSVRSYDEAQMMVLAAHPELVLVDRDMPRAEDFVARVRADSSTRHLSIAVFARGDFEVTEVSLLESGANAVLRMPVSDDWDKRLVRLMSIPLRREARFPVHLRLSDPSQSGEGVGLALNLSLHGMLVEASVPLRLHDRLLFAFRLDQSQEKVSGAGRIVRQSAAGQFGLEFDKLDYAGAARIQHFVATLPL